jgi:hypothetical protein
MSVINDRGIFENFWHGMKIVGDSLTKKATRLMNSGAPEMSDENVFEDFYDIPVGPLVSKPLVLDPTDDGKNYTIRPLNKILIEPTYDSNYNPSFKDMVEISAQDYYKIRSIGLECYVIVKIDGGEIADKYFKISRLLSSEEDQDNPDPDNYGYYRPSMMNNYSTYKYMIEVVGNLAYINDNKFSIYLTTAKAYDIDPWIISIPMLQTHINEGYSVEFKIDTDYTISENILEFNHDVFDSGEISITDTILYCTKASIIENYLYDLYGKMIDVPDWLAYNYNNCSGKTAINSILMGLQNCSNFTDYWRALNAYYGMPIAPKNSKVIGLFESYSYTITSIDGNNINVYIPVGSSLHPFIQSGSRFLVEGKKDAVVIVVPDRSVATLTLHDASYLSVGDKLNLKLKNKFIIKDIYAETATENAYITVYNQDGYLPIKHLITTIQALSEDKKYPEIIIYGTEKLSVDYNGIYHIVNCEPIINNSSLIKLTLYKKSDGVEPLYNDYIGTDMISNNDNIIHGYVHIPWPTHKFLYLLMEGNVYFKAYLDAPIDTIYDENDYLIKYQILSRNVSVFTKDMFPDWNQFDNFKKYNGISFESDIPEITRSIPGGNFGSYFPSGVV